MITMSLKDVPGSLAAQLEGVSASNSFTIAPSNGFLISLQNIKKSFLLLDNPLSSLCSST